MHSLKSIALALGAECAGDDRIVVAGLAEPAQAQPDQLAVAMDKRYLDQLQLGKARCAIIAAGTDWKALGLEGAVIVARPRLALSGLTRQFAAAQSGNNGHHATAIIAKSAAIGDDTSIAPYCVIGENATIGAGSTIGAGVTIGNGATIGHGAVIGPGVHIAANVRIGSNCILHSGAVIGTDGFSFVTEDVSHVEQVKDTMADAVHNDEQIWLKIYSIGGVVIGDNVEIGANSSVDAGTIRPTEIGDGTKIDSLVQVGHNVRVGRNCLLCAHVAVGGSAELGDNVVLGGQVGIADNIKVGDGVVAGGASKVLSNVPGGRAILGYPAVKLETHVETYKILRRLPQTLKQLKKLQDSLKPKD